MDEREAAWADLMKAAARLIEADPDATSFGRRNATCIVGVWPEAKHDLDHWPPRHVIRLDRQAGG